jgi:hypothetical protein
MEPSAFSQDTLLPLWEKVDRAKRETDEGEAAATGLRVHAL